MPSFSNIFNSIRRNIRRGVQPLPQGLTEDNSPFAEVQPIGAIIPQGVALTNIQASPITEAIPEFEGTPITQITFTQFINRLTEMIQDDTRYDSFISPDNHSRFRRAIRTYEGRVNLYTTFKISQYAISGRDFDDNNRIRLFYQGYRGSID